MGSPGRTSMTPPSRALIWPPATRTTPKPVFATPGSIPMTTIMGNDSGPEAGCLQGPEGGDFVAAAPCKAAKPPQLIHRAPETPGSGPPSGRDLLQQVRGNVEVRVNGLDVVVVVEGLHQAHHRTGIGRPDLNDVLRLHRELGGLDVHASRLERPAHCGQVLRGADHLERVPLAGDVLGPGVDRGDQVVLGVAV